MKKKKKKDVSFGYILLIIGLILGIYVVILSADLKNRDNQSSKLEQKINENVDYLLERTEKEQKTEEYNDTVLAQIEKYQNMLLQKKAVCEVVIKESQKRIDENGEAEVMVNPTILFSAHADLVNSCNSEINSLEDKVFELKLMLK